MKKYKLIKKYPSLPSSWLEGMEVCQWDGKSIFSPFTPYHKHLEHKKIGYSEVIDNPEFWQEVIEKDYEILTLKCKYSSPSYSPGDIIKHDVNCDCYNYHKLTSCFDIYSIKRLSDGEVFTVGDEVKHDRGVIFRIKTIDIGGLAKNKISFNGSFASMKRVNPIKKTLFMTEDGVEVFEGDKIWGINEGTWIPFYQYLTERIIEQKYAIFSTKEAAEEYILMNKPCLSINDVKDVMVYSIEVDKLKKIVKQKLK